MEITETYTREQLFQKLFNGYIPGRYFLFAGKGYIPKKVPFTIYQEFDNLTDFVNMRQTHIQNGLNVLHVVNEDT
jgi:hypothetical protein